MHTLVIGPASSGLLYPAAAASLGMRVSVISVARPPYAIPDDVLEIIDELVRVDSWNTDEVLGAAQALHHRHPIDAVVAGDEFLVESTGRVAQVLGLRGMPPRACQAVRDKRVMRELLAAAGIRGPRYERVNSEGGLRAAADRLGYPCIVKPPEMTASLGVTFVRDADGLAEAYRSIAPAADIDVPVTEFDGEVLVEEYVAGKEYAIDGYVLDGEAEFVFGTEYVFGPLPHFQVVGHFVESPDAFSAWPAITSYLKTVVKVLGMAYSPVHAEVILTDSGPVLVEIAGRLSGDNLPALGARVTGVSTPAVVLSSLVGIPVPPPREPTASVVVTQFVTAPHLPGSSYRTIRGWDEARARPGMLKAHVCIPPGAPIPIEQDLRSRVAYLCYTATDMNDARRAWEEIAGQVSLA